MWLVSGKCHRRHEGHLPPGLCPRGPNQTKARNVRFPSLRSAFGLWGAMGSMGPGRSWRCTSGKRGDGGSGVVVAGPRGMASQFSTAGVKNSSLPCAAGAEAFSKQRVFSRRGQGLAMGVRGQGADHLSGYYRQSVKTPPAPVRPGPRRPSSAAVCRHLPVTTGGQTASKLTLLGKLKTRGQAGLSTMFARQRDPVLLLEQPTPMAFEIDHRDLPNRVGLGPVCQIRIDGSRIYHCGGYPRFYLASTVPKAAAGSVRVAGRLTVCS
jgi:hypothetical protein